LDLPVYMLFLRFLRFAGIYRLALGA
jgi:hypothetical protein